MRINGNEIRPGNIIEHKGELWRAVKIQHVKPGKGGAFAQVELKDIRNGTKLNERFRSADSVERVRLDQMAYQYLFADGVALTFMHQENFDQITIQADLVGDDQLPFLTDGMVVDIDMYEGDPISVTLPEKVICTIAEADAVVKGQTASSSYKPAVLDNGVKILVPPHIESGTDVVVNTTTGDYVERAK